MTPPVPPSAFRQFGVPVAGFCPMGCGDKLVLLPATGTLVCAGVDCSNPKAAARILQDNETEHVVTLEEDSFTLRHPLRERIDGQLEQCQWHAFLAAYDRPPVELGQYRMTSTGGHTVEWGTVHWERVEQHG